MARLYPTLMVVPLLLAACAGSGNSPTADPPAYLTPLSSDYSIRSEELQSESFDRLRGELPKSLVAGDQELTVAADMFEKNGYLTVDLVIHNHSGRPVRISREDLYVLDYMGARLQPVADWEGAEDYGLRGRVEKETQYVYLEGQEPVPGQYGQTQPSTGGGKANEGGSTAPPVYDEGTDLDMLTEPVQIRHYELIAPPIMRIENGEKRPYWAYFKSADLIYPLNVVVRMEGRRLIFRFEGPPAG